MKKEKIDENEYIDLGLPSGTMWKSYNEDRYYTWEEAINKFKDTDTLPTVEQFYELQKECKFEWQGTGYKVTGRNGNKIILPAAGVRNRYGDVVGIGSFGSYWSSTPYSFVGAWNLLFDLGGIGVGYCDRPYGQSVRLVSKSKNR